jgi:hypothetical protein
MKKVMTIFGAILFASTILTSCGGGSIDNDAKKVAELLCKAEKIRQKEASGEMTSMEERAELASEYETLSEELKGKYTSDSDRKKFDNAFFKEMGNCN